MCLVVVSLEFLQQSFKLRLVKVLVDLSVEKGLHLVKISGVKPWGQQGLFNGGFGSLLARLSGGGGGRLSGCHFDGGEF